MYWICVDYKPYKFDSKLSQNDVLVHVFLSAIRSQSAIRDPAP